MKKSSVQAVSIGLSALTLAGTVSMTAYGKTEDSNEGVSEIEANQVENQVHDEESVAEDISNLSEQLNIDETSASLEEANSDVIGEQYEQQISEISQDENNAVQNIDSATQAVSNVDKAADAANEAIEQANEMTFSAEEITSNINNQASQVKQEADNAVATVEDSKTKKEEAAIVVADTEKSVENATAAYDSAQTKYNDTLKQYEEAKSDYKTALEAYNINKAIASESMNEAAKAFTDAEDKLKKLESDLSQAKDELSKAGAEALIAAEDNKSDKVSDYAATVLQYYYIPQAEKLSEGQVISDFKMVPSEKDSSVMQVTYSVMDSSNNVLRTVNADYGYTVDSEDGQVKLFTKDLVYQYTNSDGTVATISKEEAEKLNGKIEIDNYWTVSGYYVPTYVDNYVYEGTRSIITHTKDSAMLAGKRYVVEMYSDPKVYYKQSIRFYSDWKVDRRLLGLEYITTGSFSARYNKVKDKGGYAISTDASSAHYSSDKEAYEAAYRYAMAQAQNEQGAAYIDESESHFDTHYVVKYADIVDKYINNGDAVWNSTASGYVSYIDTIRTKLSTYRHLLEAVSNAKEEYRIAKQKTEEIKAKIDALDGGSDVISAAKLAGLELQLGKAENNLSEAKSNLEDAQKSLIKVKEIYNLRFNRANNSVDVGVVPVNSVSEDNLAVEEIKDEVPEDDDEKKKAKKKSVANSDDGYYYYSNATEENNYVATQPGQGDVLQEEMPVEDPAVGETIFIPDEETPLAITADGILQHAKWFVGLAGVSAAGAGVALAEAKRRAAAKIIDKLNL